MSITKLVHPPEKPLEVGTFARWRKYEAQLGIKLPPDYRRFVFAYGSGLFADFYRIYNPFAASESTALVTKAKHVCDFNRESQRNFPERFPYPYFPEPGGLLPWGNDENGNDYFWLTQGAPSKWVVVQDENRGKGIRVQPYTMTAFLVAILQRKTRALAGGYPKKQHLVFEPWDTSAW